MQKFNNILYLSQGITDTRDSLGQAIRLSWSNKALVRGLIVCPALPSNMQAYEETYKHSLLETLNISVQDSLSEHDISGLDIQFPIELATSDKPDLTAITYLQQHKIDLLIKDAEPSKSESIGLRAIDMNLLRKCPCPVWLNRPCERPRNHRRVAVAVNPNSSSDEEKDLSVRLLKFARTIADSCDSKLHIVSCWEYPLERYLDNHIWIKVSDEEMQTEVDHSYELHQAQLDTLIATAELDGETVIHHLHGTADEEIPHCVNSNEVDVLVMGTVARTGIPGVVIGNTAENILQNVTCSLVALKPKGFKAE